MATTKGSVVITSDMNNLMNIIKNCRSKWGSGYSAVYVPAPNEYCDHNKVNQYVTWLNDVKRRTNPGNNISVPPTVNSDELITSSWITAMINSGNSIYNHCHSNCHSNCHGNCDCAGCGTGIN